MLNLLGRGNEIPVEYVRLQKIERPNFTGKIKVWRSCDTFSQFLTSLIRLLCFQLFSRTFLGPSVNYRIYSAHSDMFPIEFCSRVKVHKLLQS